MPPPVGGALERMKKIVFFALALMVLVGAGVGGFILFGQKPKEGEAKVEEPPKPKGPPAFLQVGPIILPLVGETRVEQNILLVVSIELGNESVREQVRPLVPRLNDAFLRALYGGLGKGDVVEGQIVNVTAVKAKLVKATEEVLGPNVAQDVLIQSVTQRPAF